ncbi:MAG TPA: hypothetical protein VEI83_16375 [Acidimicrobiales bacterium]|nr:hypothetical protein [Acidimicrobiales bacterium]
MGTEELARRLAGIAEELADLAIDRLREARAALDAGGEPDPVLLADERRVTRARHSVEKAVVLLSTRPPDDDAGTD